MVEKALHSYQIDPLLSFFFGDKDRDIQCAHAAGVRGIKMDVNGRLPGPEDIIMA